MRADQRDEICTTRLQKTSPSRCCKMNKVHEMTRREKVKNKWKTNNSCCLSFEPNQHWVSKDGRVVSSLSLGHGHGEKRAATVRDLILDLVMVIIVNNIGKLFVPEVHKGEQGKLHMSTYHALLVLIVFFSPIYRRWLSLNKHLNKWDKHTMFYNLYFGFNFLMFATIAIAAKSCANNFCYTPCYFVFFTYVLIDVVHIITECLANCLFLGRVHYCVMIDIFVTQIVSSSLWIATSAHLITYSRCFQCRERFMESYCNASSKEMPPIVYVA